MNTAQTFDAIVIGSGQAGDPLVFAMAEKGWKVALVEREHLGGSCVNEGCTPTKTMVASARVAYLARRGSDFGINGSPLTIDMASIRQRKRAIVDDFRGGHETQVAKTPNVTLYMGEGSFTSANSVEVRLNRAGTAHLSAPKIFINTGTRSAMPLLPGLMDVAYLTNKTIMELDIVPDHLLVLGGGYIGLEFGQMFRRFGSQVTIVQRGEQLLGREDEDVASEVAKILRQDGINVLLNSEALRLTQGKGQSSGAIELTVKDANGERTIAGSHLLVAVGRTPNSDKLNLAAAGVEMGKGGFIKANQRLETNISGIYALGDVKGGAAFTHISYDDFRIVQENLFNDGNRSTHGRMIPYTVFIDPQLGRIGMSEAEARASGRKIRIAKLPMSYVARAIEMAESRGFMKAIVDADSGEILGATVLGIEGGEITTMLQIAMMGKLPYSALRDAIFPHPGFAEALNNLFTFGWQDQ